MPCDWQYATCWFKHYLEWRSSLPTHMSNRHTITPQYSRHYQLNSNRSCNCRTLSELRPIYGKRRNQPLLTQSSELRADMTLVFDAKKGAIWVLNGNKKSMSHLLEQQAQLMGCEKRRKVCMDARCHQLPKCMWDEKALDNRPP